MRLILPPLRQCGIEPHRHASLATSGSLTLTPNQRLPPALSRLDKRGVRVVTNVEAGCGGRDGDARRAALLADGKAVWSWRPDAGVKFRGFICGTTVAKEPGHRREHVISRKTIAQGRPGISGEPVVTMLVCFITFAREAAGATGTQLSLRHLLCSRDNNRGSTRADHVARGRTLVLLFEIRIGSWREGRGRACALTLRGGEGYREEECPPKLPRRRMACQPKPAKKISLFSPSWRCPTPRSRPSGARSAHCSRRATGRGSATALRRSARP
jgi:hypothetical protein